MVIFPLINLCPTLQREALHKKVHPMTPSQALALSRCSWAICPQNLGRAARQDRPIRRSLALCSFRPLTRRRCCGRRGSWGCRGPGRLGWRWTLVAMEWGSESGAVRRHRIGGEHRDGPAPALQPEREAAAQESLADACGGGGARTRKRSAKGSGGASRGAETGLSEGRAALGLALYLLALRALVQLSLQQLMLHRAAGHSGEFNARQARYRGSCLPAGFLAAVVLHLCAPTPAGPWGLVAPPPPHRLHVGWGGLARPPL